MISFTASIPYTLALLLLVGVYVALKLRKETLQELLKEKAPLLYRHGRTFLAIICVPLGYVLLEYTYNPWMVYIHTPLLVLGLVLFAVVFCAVFFLAQRTKGAMLAFLIICFALGIALHFIVIFKNAPILPSDLMALGTAADVSAGYVYPIDDSILGGLSLIVAFACLLQFVPKQTITKKSACINIAVGLAAVVLVCGWYATTDLEEDCGVEVNAWYALDAYRGNGAVLSFMQCAQNIDPAVPEGYTRRTADKLLKGNNKKLPSSPSEQELKQAQQATAPNVKPHIIAIMNETFADISQFSALSKKYKGIPEFNTIAKNSLVSGTAYVSVSGGGTCNSELEFLTGSTTGLIGTGIYPYVQYNMAGADNLARYLGELGYQTTAIHPATMYNWRRDIIYDQFGFDAFLDEAAFEDAKTRRGRVIDSETYDLVLKQLKHADKPQFIFDLTIANHSGYDTGRFPKKLRIKTKVNGKNVPEVNEYISCINRSDIEFAQFMKELQKIDEPIVVCFFGDHQSLLVDDLATASYGVEVTEMNIEQTQSRFSTPYLIWTNSPELISVYGGTGHNENVSLNYLGADMLKAAGLPLDSYFGYLYAMQAKLPLININGYMTADGTWYSFNNDPASVIAGSNPDDPSLYRGLSLVQYRNLFDSDNKK